MIEFILGSLIVILIIILPVHLAGKMVDAKRIGFGWCLLAIFLAAIFQFISHTFFLYGFFVTPFVTALAYALVMQTTYLKGIAIAILQFFLTIIIATLLVTFSFASLSLLTFPF